MKVVWFYGEYLVVKRCLAFKNNLFVRRRRNAANPMDFVDGFQASHMLRRLCLRQKQSLGSRWLFLEERERRKRRRRNTRGERNLFLLAFIIWTCVSRASQKKYKCSRFDNIIHLPSLLFSETCAGPSENISRTSKFNNPIRKQIAMYYTA